MSESETEYDVDINVENDPEKIKNGLKNAVKNPKGVLTDEKGNPIIELQVEEKNKNKDENKKENPKPVKDIKEFPLLNNGKLPDDFNFKYDEKQVQSDFNDVLGDNLHWRNNIRYSSNDKDKGATNSLPAYFTDAFFNSENNTVFGNDGTNLGKDGKKNVNSYAIDAMSTEIGGTLLIVLGAVLMPVAPIAAIIIWAYFCLPDSTINDFMDQLNKVTHGASNEVKKAVGSIINDKEMAEGKHQKSFSDKQNQSIEPAIQMEKERQARFKKVVDMVQNATCVFDLGNALRKEALKISKDKKVDPEKFKKIEILQKRLSEVPFPKISDIKKLLESSGILETQEGKSLIEKTMKFLEKTQEFYPSDHFKYVLKTAINDMYARSVEVAEKTKGQEEPPKQEKPKQEENPTPSSQKPKLHVRQLDDRETRNPNNSTPPSPTTPPPSPSSLPNSNFPNIPKPSKMPDSPSPIKVEMPKPILATPMESPKIEKPIVPETKHESKEEIEQKPQSNKNSIFGSLSGLEGGENKPKMNIVSETLKNAKEKEVVEAFKKGETKEAKEIENAHKEVFNEEKKVAQLSAEIASMPGKTFEEKLANWEKKKREEAEKLNSSKETSQLVDAFLEKCGKASDMFNRAFNDMNIKDNNSASRGGM